jgi:hypothetical protein
LPISRSLTKTAALMALTDDFALVFLMKLQALLG